MILSNLRGILKNIISSANYKEYKTVASNLNHSHCKLLPAGLAFSGNRVAPSILRVTSEIPWNWAKFTPTESTGYFLRTANVCSTLYHLIPLSCYPSKCLLKPKRYWFTWSERYGGTVRKNLKYCVSSADFPGRFLHSSRPIFGGFFGQFLVVI